VDRQKKYKGMILSIIVLAAPGVMVTPLYASDGKAVYKKSCKICHGNGSAGAPKAGDADAWKERIAKGNELLYDHAINGFREKGIMPAKGGNKKLTDDEVKAAVDYLLQLVK